MTEREAKEIRKRYPRGTLVKCIEMMGEPQMENKEGIIQYVDDAGQIHVAWDNGSGLALIPEADKFVTYGRVEE